jgi:hypothetical protein
MRRRIILLRRESALVDSLKRGDEKGSKEVGEEGSKEVSERLAIRKENVYAPNTSTS